MKIAISTLVTPANKLGIGNYVLNLLNAFQEIDQKDDFYIFIGKDTKHLFSISKRNFHPIYLPFSHDPRWLMRPMYFFWQNSLINIYLRRFQIEVLHLPNLLPILVRFIPTVVTIHDLAEYKAVRYGKIRQLYRRTIPHLIARKADRIITVSQSAKQDIVKFTKASPDKIDVTYLASTINNHERVLIHKYDIESEYILYVGSFLPHKNLKRLIEAFALLKKDHQIPHQLVLIGTRDEFTAGIVEFSKRFSIQDQIICTGYVPDHELLFFYTHASLFVYPSLHEGFGLPVLEAMTCGIPVVTSNISSLPEVAGDAAVLIDPVNPESIANGIFSVLKDEKLRGEMIVRGKAQAERFSWQDCAKLTLECYRKAMK